MPKSATVKIARSTLVSKDSGALQADHTKKKARLANGIRHAAVRRTPAPSTLPPEQPTQTAVQPSEPSIPLRRLAVKTFMIVAGSYEKLLYGLEGTFSDVGSSNPIPTLKPVFIFPAHGGSVRAIAASPEGGKWLATGSTDEVVKVWNLRRRKEIGGLQQHEGSITYISFPTRTTMVTASEDGTLCIFRTRGWELLRSLKGHTGRVNCVAVHPSGKVALSVGKDRTLRMWDLMRGKGAASVKLGEEGELVRWSLDGQHFVVQSQKSIDLYSVDMKLLNTIDHPSRIHDVRFCTHVGGTHELLLVGAEDKKTTIYDIKGDGTSRVVAELVGHANRVKSLDTINVSLPTPAKPSTTTYVATISSDGFINLYDLSAVTPNFDTSLPPVFCRPITSYDTKGSRLTCVTFAEGESADDPSVNGNRQREDQTDVSEDEGKNDVSQHDATTDAEHGK